MKLTIQHKMMLVLLAIVGSVGTVTPAVRGAEPIYESSPAALVPKPIYDNFGLFRRPLTVADRVLDPTLAWRLYDEFNWTKDEIVRTEVSLSRHSFENKDYAYYVTPTSGSKWLCQSLLIKTEGDGTGCGGGCDPYSSLLEKGGTYGTHFLFSEGVPTGMIVHGLVHDGVQRAGLYLDGEKVAESPVVNNTFVLESKVMATELRWDTGEIFSLPTPD